MLLIGRERGKGRTGKIPEKIGKTPTKSGKSQEGEERTKKVGHVQIEKNPPPFETSLVSGT